MRIDSPVPAHSTTPDRRRARGWLLVGGGLTMSAIAPAAGVSDPAPQRWAVVSSQSPTPVDVVRYAMVPKRAPVAPSGFRQPDDERRPDRDRPDKPAIVHDLVPVAFLANQRPLGWPAATPAVRPFAALRDAALTGAPTIDIHAIVVAARSPAGTAVSPVDIEQIADIAQGRERMPQLSDTRAASQVLLADAAAEMQVAPAGRSDETRSAMLALAPDQLTLRIGDAAVGAVDIAMTDTSTIAVQLGSLLDVMAERMGPAEYEHLRSSSAADGYVSLDTLRDAGIAVRYDPAYDELQLSV